MDRSLDDRIAERQRTTTRARRGPPPPRRINHDYPRDGVRKSTRDEKANLDNDWVHDRYDDEPSTTRGGGYARSRPRRDDRNDGYSPERRAAPPPAKIRVENLHYDLTEDDIYDLFTRIAPVMDAKLKYDRAGRSEGIAFVTYEHVADARTAIREFDGANAKGQPIRLFLQPLPSRRDNPFDRVENPKSLFDRIEAPSGRSRRRSDSPLAETGGDRRADVRRGATESRDRRSDVTRPPPENIDRYVPGQSSRSSSNRGGRRPGERREREPREPRENGRRTANGRPRKTAEELDAEMEDYWGGAGDGAQETSHAATASGPPAAAQNTASAATMDDDDINMIE